jgi:CRP-like cAMP-binding protein
LENVKNHSLTAQAITAIKVRVFKKQVLNALVSSDVRVAQQLLSLTAVELTRQQELHLLLCRPAQERVIHFLVDMAQRGSPNEDDLIALPMYRQDIADYLGLTIETVSRMWWSPHILCRYRSSRTGPYHLKRPMAAMGSLAVYNPDRSRSDNVT